VTQRISCYDIFELNLTGPQEGNPYTDVTLSVRFQHGNRVLETEGFYDGETDQQVGLYRIRLMPDETGQWHYITKSNVPELNGVRGSFECLAARPGVHGPVRVANTCHFAYADGKRYFPVGTTCYAWVHQPPELQEQTLKTLASAPFNKIRMCVFPKDYTYNKNEPTLYPYRLATKKDHGWDFNRFHIAFWRNFEQRIRQLAELGIEADIILFHPYDRWGFSRMGAENDDRYVRYIVARLAAYRNVWWSLANEYGIIASKTLADWERLFHLIETHDPHQHLRSIHNWTMLDEHSTSSFYDFTKPWVTHCSIQHAHTDLTNVWRELYRKPIMIDEACYEGNIPDGWGNLSAQEMVHRFWETAVRGGYCGHGETYIDPNDILWWSKGGVLKGTSPQRIAFLRQVLDAMPEGWIDPLERLNNACQASGGIAGTYILHYFGRHQSASVTFYLPAGEFRAEILDTWEMTITPVEGVFHNQLTIPLPGKPYLAVRIEKITEI
jgi:Domain of unknown function (DUF5605)/Domain of unknown function (DUF5060)/Protein of unknown function (DUF4038)